LLFQLAPLAHGTEETDCGLWLTPTATAIGERSDESMIRRQAQREMSGRMSVPPGNLAEQVNISGQKPCPDMRKAALWPTPTVGGGGQTLPEGTTPTGNTPDGRKQTVCLERYVQNVERNLWPTPDIRGFTNKGSLQMLARKANSREEWAQMSYRTSHGVREKLWPTPRASGQGDAARSENRTGNRHAGDDLTTAVMKVEGLWPTPTTQDASNNAVPSQFERNSLPLNAAVGGRLNPQWVEWLMGYPIGWTDCGRSATPSFRKSQKSSEKQS
jgi:hypothetical protein